MGAVHFLELAVKMKLKIMSEKHGFVWQGSTFYEKGKFCVGGVH